MQGSNDQNRCFWIRRPASPSIIVIDGDAGRRMKFQTHINTIHRTLLNNAFFLY